MNKPENRPWRVRDTLNGWRAYYETQVEAQNLYDASVLDSPWYKNRLVVEENS